MLPSTARRIASRSKSRRLAVASAVFVLASAYGAGFVPTMTAAHASSSNDIDHDGIKNGKDRDVDGDGQLNGDDRDVDGDGIQNDDPAELDMDADGKNDDSNKEKDIDGDGKKDDSKAEDDIDSDGHQDGDCSNETDTDGDDRDNRGGQVIEPLGLAEHLHPLGPGPTEADMDGDGKDDGAANEHDIDGDGQKDNGDGHGSDMDDDNDCTPNPDDCDDDGDGVMDEFQDPSHGDILPRDVRPGLDLSRPGDVRVRVRRHPDPGSTAHH